MNSQGSIFVLSGEELTLPFAEIRALVETYSKNAEVELSGKRVAITSTHDAVIVQEIAERAAYCRFGGILVSRSEDFKSLASSIDLAHWNPNNSFAVRSYTMEKEQCGELGAAIKFETRSRVSLENPDYLFQVEESGGSFFLGVSSYGYKRQSWRARRPRARKFFLPSAIFPKLARTLVNLSHVRRGDIFLDPFCGTGSLLIESAVMGIDSLGIDLTRWIARGSLLNMKGFGLSSGVMRADSTRQFPLKSVDAVATDVPYGRASSTKGKSTEKILSEFLNAIWDSLSSSKERHRYCVVMHPSTLELDEIKGNFFQLQEQHLLYVHRNLTRAISILRKE